MSETLQGSPVAMSAVDSRGPKDWLARHSYGQRAILPTKLDELVRGGWQLKTPGPDGLALPGY